MIYPHANVFNNQVLIFPSEQSTQDIPHCSKIDGFLSFDCINFPHYLSLQCRRACNCTTLLFQFSVSVFSIVHIPLSNICQAAYLWYCEDWYCTIIIFPWALSVKTHICSIERIGTPQFLCNEHYFQDAVILLVVLMCFATSSFRIFPNRFIRHIKKK